MYKVTDINLNEQGFAGWIETDDGLESPHLFSTDIEEVIDYLYDVEQDHVEINLDDFRNYCLAVYNNEDLDQYEELRKSLKYDISIHDANSFIIECGNSEELIWIQSDAGNDGCNLVLDEQGEYMASISADPESEWEEFIEEFNEDQEDY